MAPLVCAKCNRPVLADKRRYRCGQCRAWFCPSCMDRFCLLCKGPVAELKAQASLTDIPPGPPPGGGIP